MPQRDVDTISARNGYRVTVLSAIELGTHMARQGSLVRLPSRRTTDDGTRWVEAKAST